jgi:hypothetical protein
MGSGVHPGMGAEDVAQERVGRAVQQQAGSEISFLVPGIEQGKTGAVPDDVSVRA